MPPETRTLEPAQSAALLEKALPTFRGELTVADAAARGGLALRDAETALFKLAGDYHGHLKATSEGEVVFSFPRGFVKQETGSALTRFAKKVGGALVGVGRFVVRAWVSVVMVGYAVVFLVLMIAWALKSEEGEGIGEAIAVVGRVLLEALFWTFHPFSPVYMAREPGWMREHGLPGRKRAPKLPFYERVNRFVFGPPEPKVDPRQVQSEVLTEVRRLAGRVGPTDLMRVTGESREDAEAQLCRMVVDYDGGIDVTGDGAVVYKFPALRRTVESGRRAEVAAPRPIWEKPVAVPPLTGNEAGTNVFLGAVNTFNLGVSGWVVAQGAGQEMYGTVEQLYWGFGVIPFTFSAMLFALPLGRLIFKKRREKKAARENGRRGLLRVLTEGRMGAIVQAKELSLAWIKAGGGSVDEQTLTEEVRALGGEPDVDDAGRLVYKFEEVDREVKALQQERRIAPAAEESVGEVLFGSDDSHENDETRNLPRLPVDTRGRGQ